MAEARTLAEAYMYLELTLPAGESWVDYDRYTTLRTVGDRYLLRFDGPYEGQHCTAEVSVPLASHRAAGDDPTLSYGDGPSRLIDAGQWYAIEAAYAAMARAGLEQLAAGSPDPEQSYWATVEAWASAAAAAGEIEKFLPDGVEEVPADAFWTEQGRLVHGQRPDGFRRTRLVDAQAHYQRQGKILRARHDAPAPVEPADRPVRTFAEAHVYLDLHPCGCGSVGFPRDQMSVLTDDESGVRVRYEGACDHCGQSREFTFGLPPRRAVPPESPYRFSYVEDGPSTVVDPGEWLGVSDGYTIVADAILSTVDLPGGRLDPAGREDLVKLLTGAAAAVDEVRKFLPPGADALPDRLLWSAGGRELYAADPHRFDRVRLDESAAGKWERLDEFTRRHPLSS